MPTQSLSNIYQVNTEYLEEHKYGRKQFDQPVDIVKRGKRPPIDLNAIPPNSYEKGKIQVKLQPFMGHSVPDNSILTASPEGYVKTGNNNIDALNQKFGAKKFKPLLYGLYEKSPQALLDRGKHMAWGFHLWFEITIYTDADIIAAVKAFASLEEIKTAEPVYKKRLIKPLEEAETNVPKRGRKKWTPNDPFYPNNQWHFNNTGQTIGGQTGIPGVDISLEDAWEIEKGNPDVIVAIVDNGVQYTHPDLHANMWEDIGPEGTSTTPASHGTHVQVR